MRILQFLLAVALGVATVSCAAQPPYELTLEQANDLREKLERNMRFHRPGLPYGHFQFRLITVDASFVPKAENASLPLSGVDAARQSFVAKSAHGNIEAIHVYIEQAPAGGKALQEVKLELYEGLTNDPIVPKQLMLATATTKVLNASAVKLKQWVVFELNKPVKSWTNRRLVIVLGALASPGVLTWVGDHGNPYAGGQSAKGAFGFAPMNDVDLGFRVINVR